MKPLYSSDYKRTLLAAHVGWWSTVIIVALRTTHILPQAASSFAFLTLGLGVTASLALSRMKLGATVSQVFQTGLSVAVSMNSSGGMNHGTAVIRTDLEGCIKSGENTEVIGWPNGEAERLAGKRLDDLIPDRFLRINHAALTSYREASAGGTDESGVVIAFNLPIRGADGTERAFRMTIARLGDTLIKTLVPLSEKLPEALN